MISKSDIKRGKIEMRSKLDRIKYFENMTIIII